MVRFEKMVGALENRANAIDGEVHGRIASVDESMTQWRKTYEGKVDGRLEELQRAIK